MTAIASLSDLVNRLSGGNSGTPENLSFHRNGRIAGVADVACVVGRLSSMWKWDGYPNPGGATPGAVAVPTRATAGALGQVNPGGGREKWLVGGGATGLVAGTVILYDRLLHIGGLSGTVTTAQTVGGTLTRNTGGVGNVIWVEIYTIIGTTATTITSSYTDDAGNAGQATTAVAFGGTNLREVSRIIQLPLAAGDRGVQACASVTVLATTGTAGNFGVTIARPLAYLQITQSGLGPWLSFIDGAPIPEIDTDACLAMAWMPTVTTNPEVFGMLTMVEA
jgi:hypothetical protein